MDRRKRVSQLPPSRRYGYFDVNGIRRTHEREEMSTPIIEPTAVENLVAAGRAYEGARGRLEEAEKELEIEKKRLAQKEVIAAECRAAYEKAVKAVETIAKKI